MGLVPKLTKAQKRALEWLPADGSWKTGILQDVSRALDSLIMYHRTLVTSEYGGFGVRGGNCRRVCLTPDGVEVRKALFDPAPQETE